MVFIFSLVLLTAAAYHQYGIAYMFAVDYAFGDFLPLITVSSILLLQLIRYTGKFHISTELFISVIPLIVTILAVGSKKIITQLTFAPELLWYPPVILAVTAAIFFMISRYHKQKYLSYMALAYMIGVLLTLGYSQDKAQPLNWQLSGAGIVAILLAFGIVRKNPTLCFSAIIVLSLGLNLTKWFALTIHNYNLAPICATVGIAGIGSILIALVFGKKTPKLITLFAAVASIVFLFDVTPIGLKQADLGILIASAVISAAFWLRPKDILAAVISWIPVVPRIHLFFRDMSSWGFVLLSFILLFVGAYVSIFVKGSRSASNRDKVLPEQPQSPDTKA